MKPTLLKHFFRHNAAAVLMVWLALVCLLALFEILRRADDGWARAMLLGALKTPVFALQVLPFACAIGAVLAARRMVADGEMAALRAAGLSPLAIALFNGGAALLFVFAYLFISETLLPPAADAANAVANRQTAARALWLKNGDDYVRADKLQPGGRMENIVIYHTRGRMLNAVTEAASAQHGGGGGWRLHRARRAAMDGSAPVARETAAWDLSMAPESFSAFLKKPRDMSLFTAAAAAAELSAAGQNPRRLREKLWLQLEILFALPLLAAAAVRFIGGERKSGATSVAVLLTALLAGVYYIVAEITAQTAVLTGAPVLLLLPPLLLAAFVARGIVKN